MITSEQEAQKNRCVHGVDTGPCIGSQCMAWRWYGYAETKPAEGLQPAREIWWEPDPKFRGAYTGKSVRRGYCGLAGFPS